MKFNRAHLVGAPDPSVEVIVLARGGGSLEDLWNFNREELVRAVFELKTPVVSAIGHETDWVLLDVERPTSPSDEETIRGT